MEWIRRSIKPIGIAAHILRKSTLRSAAVIGLGRASLSFLWISTYKCLLDSNAGWGQAILCCWRRSLVALAVWAKDLTNIPLPGSIFWKVTGPALWLIPMAPQTMMLCPPHMHLRNVHLFFAKPYSAIRRRNTKVTFIWEEDLLIAPMLTSCGPLQSFLRWRFVRMGPRAGRRQWILLEAKRRRTMSALMGRCCIPMVWQAVSAVVVNRQGRSMRVDKVDSVIPLVWGPLTGPCPWAPEGLAMSVWIGLADVVAE